MLCRKNQANCLGLYLLQQSEVMSDGPSNLSNEQNVNFHHLCFCYFLFLPCFCSDYVTVTVTFRQEGLGQNLSQEGFCSRIVDVEIINQTSQTLVKCPYYY